MQPGLQKLKSKLELLPKFTAYQQHTLISNIFVFDLSLEIDARDVVDICKNHQIEKFKEKSTESVYAWRSDYLYVSDNHIPDFDKLFDITLAKVTSVPKGIPDSEYTYQVDHFWFAIYNKGDSSLVHNHTHDYACVYYANVPENSAPLLIPSANGNITITPTTGMLVVMPSHCNHSVPKSNHEGERIIVAMNLSKLKHKKAI